MKLKLREWMDIRDVNQSQVAAALGISRAAVSSWVEGKVRNGVRVKVFPDSESLDALCAFFDCTPGDLLEQEARETPTGKTWKDFSGLAVA